MTHSNRIAIATVFAFAFTSLLAAAPAFAKVCVHPTKTNCEPTIQAGIDAADAGETVSVQKGDGPYIESVVIPNTKDGLRLVGNKGAVLWPTPGGNVGITIEADDVLVRNLTIANGEDCSIELDNVVGTVVAKNNFRTPFAPALCIDDSPGTVFEKNNVWGVVLAVVSTGGSANDLVVRNNRGRGLDDSFVAVDGDNVWVHKNNVQVANGCVAVITGDAATVTSNKGTEWGCIADVVGDDAIVSKNTVTGTDEGVLVLGDNAEVVNNKVTDSEDAGITVQGADPVVNNNRVIGSSATAIGVACDPCSGGSVSRNRVQSAQGSGIGVTQDGTVGLEILNNVIQNSSTVGLGIGSLNATVDGVAAGNRIDTGGVSLASCGLGLVGDLFELDNNRVNNWGGTGICIDGANNLIEKNRATFNSADGISVSGSSSDGNIVYKNVAENNLHTGIALEVGTTNTDLTDNKALKNTSVDLCIAGTTIANEGNKYDTLQDDFGVACPL